MSSTAQNSTEVVVSGTYAFTLFPKGLYNRGSNAEKTWMVIRYKADDGKSFIACGKDLPTIPDVKVRLRGVWHRSESYGPSLHITSYEIPLPTTEKGFIAYISSLKVGIGRGRAEKLYEMFGETAWDVLESDPKAMKAVPGVTDIAISKLKDKVGKSKIERELMHLFSSVSDMSASMARELHKQMGDDVIAQIKHDPYCICHYSEFGFRTADKLGRRLGVSPGHPSRLQEAILYVLQDAEAAGHTCLPKNKLMQRLKTEVNRPYPDNPVTDQMLIDALNAAWKEKHIRITSDMVYRTVRYRQERMIVEEIQRLLHQSASGISNVEDIIRDFELVSGMTLEESQKKAVITVFRTPVSVITGGPGTGKTSIVKAILYAHKTIYGNRSAPVLLSPTGRAARRLYEVTGYPAQTVHSAVGFTGREDLDSSLMDTADVIDGNLFIVDEASMLDLFIAGVLLHKIPDNARIVFVGDPDQLPCVGCGNVLAELIRSQTVPVFRLKTIFRQAGNSLIVKNAEKIRNGDTALETGLDFSIIEESNGTDVFRRACGLYLENVRRIGASNVILICPYRQKTELNVSAFNKAIQQILNPAREGELTMPGRDGVEFRPRDRVMQMKNTEFARNGDIGDIISITKVIDPEDPTEYALEATVDFNGDGKYRTYDTKTIHQLDLAYCTTVHKSQGAEFSSVIVVLSEEHTAMLRRNLLYTAVTRGKKSVVVVTEGEIDGNTAIVQSIRNNTTNIRYSLLGDRLHDAAQQGVLR